MIFHIGFSKRISIKSIFTLISALFVGLCAFLGITNHEIVYAAPVTLSPSSAAYYNNLFSEPFSPSISLVDNVGYQNLGAYYFDITNPGSISFNFTYFYNAQNLCPDTNYRASGSFQYSLEGNNSGSNVSMVYSNGSTIPISLNNSVITFNNIDFSRSFKIVFNSADGNNSTGLYIDRGWNITCNTDPNQSVIDNQNLNTQDIINNNNQNTQDIIDNQNSNNEALIDSQKVCSTKVIDSSFNITSGYLSSTGSIVSSSSYGITSYFPLASSSYLSVIESRYAGVYNCFYNSDKVLISCFANSSVSSGQAVSIPDGSSFVRFSINNESNTPRWSLYSCFNGNQAVVDSNNQLNDNLTDSNVDGALTTGNDFFDNFQIDDSRGFSSIVIAPIQFLRDLLTSSSSCSPLSISFNPSDGNFSGSANWSIPCGDILWSKAPQGVVLVWYTLIYGLLGYRILVDMVKFINKTLNPEDTSEYIMDL